MNKREKRPATLAVSLATLICLFLFVGLGVSVFNADLSLLLFLSWLVAGMFAIFLGYTFADVEEAAYDMAKNCIGPAAIIISVGIMIAAFIAAGTVPTLLVAGLKVITPRFFLLITFIMCCLMSTVTGTSWGTIGTVGIAMFGVGTGLGVNPAITTGAIVSGAWFGDKMSPMSDSTNLCSAITKTPIMDHIRHMMLTTVPAGVIAAVIYTVIGFTQGSGSYDASTLNGIISELESIFHISVLCVLPILLVVVMIALKKSTIGSLLSGAALAVLIAVFYQGCSIAEIGGYLYNGFSIESDNAVVSSLLNRGGMAGMLGLIGTFIGALGLGGILSGTGLLQPVFDRLSGSIKSAKGVLLMAWVVTLICILVISTNNFAFVMCGTLFAPLLEHYHLKSQNLSRILEDVGTVGSALVPWNVGAVFVAGVLGVGAVQFAPYAFLNWLVPITSLLYILFDFKITRTEAD